MPGFDSYHLLSPAMAKSADRIAAASGSWEEFAQEIAEVELELASVAKIAGARSIWADRTTLPPGHHEANLLEAVRVAIAQLRGAL